VLGKDSDGFVLRRLSELEEDRMTRRLGVMSMAVLFTAGCLAAAGGPAYGQTTQAPPAETKPGEAKPEEKKEEKPKTLWEENTLFTYVENSVVWIAAVVVVVCLLSSAGGSSVRPGWRWIPPGSSPRPCSSFS
jgi:hypothetical protein